MNIHSNVITDLEQLTPAWLTEVLQKKGYLLQGRVVEVYKEPVVYRAICPLKLRYSPAAPANAPSELVLKFSKPKYSVEVARIVGKKEVEFYTSLATNLTRPPILRCYDAAFNAEAGVYHVLLENPSQTHYATSIHLETPITNSEAEQMVDCLAYLHVAFWEDERLGKEIGHLPTQEATQAFERYNLENLGGFLDFASEHIDSEGKRICEAVLTNFPGLLFKRLNQPAGKAITLAHGDSYPGNFLFPRESTQQIYLLDWQQWEVSSGMFDLAYLLSLLISDSYKGTGQPLVEKLLRRYHLQLSERGITNYDWPSLRYDYQLFSMRNLLRPFWGWTNHLWNPNRWIQLERALQAFKSASCWEIL